MTSKLQHPTIKIIKRNEMKKALLLALLCITSFFVIAASGDGAHSRSFARQNGHFTLEQILSSPFPTDLVAAPEGSRIAWVFDVQGKRNIWAAEGPDFKAR